MKVTCIKTFRIGIDVCKGDILEVDPQNEQFQYITSKAGESSGWWWNMSIQEMVKYTTYETKNRFKIL